MKSPRKWLREWLGLNKPYVELFDDLDKGGEIRLIAHLPDERAIKRRERLVSIWKSPWTIGLTCAVVGAVAGVLAAKFF